MENPTVTFDGYRAKAALDCRQALPLPIPKDIWCVFLKMNWATQFITKQLPAILSVKKSSNKHSAYSTLMVFLRSQIGFWITNYLFFLGSPFGFPVLGNVPKMTWGD